MDENHQESESRPSGGEMLNLDHPGGISLLISPPDGLDSAQVLSNFQLQFLRLMALPGIEESSYLAAV